MGQVSYTLTVRQFGLKAYKIQRHLAIIYAGLRPRPTTSHPDTSLLMTTETAGCCDKESHCFVLLLLLLFCLFLGKKYFSNLI